MSIPSYPVLEAVPSVKKFGHRAFIDPVHRSKFMCGADFSRTLFTGIPDEYDIYYEEMGNADKLILEAWEKDDIEYGGIAFSWENIKKNKTYKTKLIRTIHYSLHPACGGTLSGFIWIVSFRIITLSEIE